ncbi:MAG: MFS transporter [Promethearchaeota archaeon]|jgi:GPH family glycoside/pentoside/hexuronide:cation symporter
MSNSNLKQDVNIERYGKGQKWSFGMASFAQFFINSAFNTWVFSFYFTAVGLHALTITAAFSIWTLWNAFNDPLIGFLSDRTKTRWGRRRPYLMIGFVPVLIIEIIIWIPPTGNELLGFIYLLIMLICYDTFYTMLALPTDSLFPELYTSAEERAEVNTIRQVLSMVGLILAFLVPGIFIGDLTEMSGYLINGIVTSIIVGVTMFIFIKWGAKERVEFKMDYETKFSFFKGLSYTFKNKGFLLYTAMFFLYNYTLLVLATTVPLYGVYVLGLQSDATLLIALLLGAMFIISILAVIVWRKLDVRLGSKKAYGISVIAYIVTSIPLLTVSTYMVGLIVVILMGFGFGGMLYFVYLIIADVIDEDELKTGVRREGTFFGITNFFMRLSMILSILTVGLVFAGTDWGEHTPIPGVNTIIGLKLLVFMFPAIALCITLVCLYFYPFSKSRVEEIKEKLLELHKEKREKARFT